MKKIISIFITITLCMTVLFSCKKEKIVHSGSVMLYTTISEEAAMAIKLDFEKMYPGVILDYYYGDNDRVNRKINTEFESGQPNADVVFLSDRLFLEDMKSKSRLESYNSNETKKIPAEYKDNDSFYTAGTVTTMGIGFNKSTDYGIDEKNAPKNWEDFLSNDYKGKMALANPQNDNYVKYWVMAMMQNQKYGDTFFRRLRDYGVVIKGKEIEVVDNIVSGVYTVGICYDNLSSGFLKEFEDFKFKYAESDNITMMSGIGLVKDSLNKENGKLLIDYILSKKGQEILVANGFPSARTDVKNNFNTKQVISESINVDMEDINKNGNDYMTIFNDIFGD